MSKPIQRIGRKFGDSAIANMIDSSSQSRTFTLKSGAKATFVRQLILHDDIETRTTVDPQINGRDQSTLTPESLQEITRTITLQQFFPAIGRINGDQIEIMDGSRRRAACIRAGVRCSRRNLGSSPRHESRRRSCRNARGRQWRAGRHRASSHRRPSGGSHPRPDRRSP